MLLSCCADHITECLQEPARKECPCLLEHDEQVVFLPLEVLPLLLSLQCDLRRLLLQCGDSLLQREQDTTVIQEYHTKHSKSQCEFLFLMMI